MAGRISKLLRGLETQPPPPSDAPQPKKESRYLRALRQEIELQQRRKPRKK